MATYIVSYELQSPGQKYGDLYDELKSLGAWWHHVTSTWLVDTSLTASEIRDRAMKHLDANDKLVVIRAGSTWATYGLNDRANTWLQQHV